MLVKTYGCAVQGIDASIITIEVNVGMPFGFAMVGLPDNAVRESRERIETSIKNNGYDWPRAKITINMAPADVRKEGSAYDLSLAIGVLAASKQVKPKEIGNYLIMGELSLDGKLRPIKGVLPIAIKAKKEGMKGFILPEANAQEAAIVAGLDVIPVKSLAEAVEFLNKKITIEPVVKNTREIFAAAQDNGGLDFADVKGQLLAKRGMEVAAAGGHNILMIGPPGAGKTMLARRIPTILPPFTLKEALESTKIHSVAGTLGDNASLMAVRPFRSPHHTTSDVALVGGGTFPQPGEISLAHNGVLFLDELPEFRRNVLEVMRQPLEERKVTVSRARLTVEFPANFMLIASMNPCPCGFYNHPGKNCICGSQNVRRYLGRVSGPLIDRIDLQLEVTPVNFEQLSSKKVGEKSADIRDRVVKAREIQLERFRDQPDIYCNAMIPPSLVRKHCNINPESKRLLQQGMEILGFSARAYDRILKVARTVADLSGVETIQTEHIAEAIGYRNLDREGWAG